MPKTKNVNTIEDDGFEIDNRDLSQYTSEEIIDYLKTVEEISNRADIDDKETFKKSFITLKDAFDVLNKKDTAIQMKTLPVFYNIFSSVLKQTYLDIEKLNTLFHEKDVFDLSERIDYMYDEFDKKHDKYEHYSSRGIVFKNNIQNEVTVEENINNINDIANEAKDVTKSERNNPERLTNLIVDYRKAKTMHDNRSFFTKVIQFFTGNKESKALKSLENAIRESTDITKSEMDKAFKAPNEGRVGAILRYGSRDARDREIIKALNEPTKTEKSEEKVVQEPEVKKEVKKQIEVSQKDLGEEELDNDGFEIEGPATVSKSKEQLEEEAELNDFEIEI